MQFIQKLHVSFTENLSLHLMVICSILITLTNDNLSIAVNMFKVLHVVKKHIENKCSHL